MRPGLRVTRIWFVSRLASSEYLLTMPSSQHRIRDLDAKVVAQHTELGTCDSEIALLKRRIEEVERAHSRKQRELTSAVKRLASQDAEIANLRREKTRAMDAARIDKRTIDKLVAERSLWKKRTRPTVSIHSVFCYFRARY